MKMEMKVEKLVNLKIFAPISVYDRSETTGQCETFQQFERSDNK